jgi:(5-formylfuran-3-yl)methyl phosphate synthase
MIPNPLSVPNQPEQGTPPRLGHHLLVSVRDYAEAQLVQALGVQWIDLKNPAAGSLGAADALTALRVSTILAGNSGLLTSAAAGELHNATPAAQMLAPLFPLIKVGMAGLQGDDSWAGRLQVLRHEIESAGSQLVPVIYADYEACRAPTPHQILAAVEQMDQAVSIPGSQRYMLVDTHTKDGRRLLDWLSAPQLKEIIHQAHQQRRQVVLAGSLALADLPKLLKLPAAAIAVRSAVCTTDRSSPICAQKIADWLRIVENR